VHRIGHNWDIGFVHPEQVVPKLRTNIVEVKGEFRGPESVFCILLQYPATVCSSGDERDVGCKFSISNDPCARNDKSAIDQLRNLFNPKPLLSPGIHWGELGRMILRPPLSLECFRDRPIGFLWVEVHMRGNKGVRHVRSESLPDIVHVEDITEVRSRFYWFIAAVQLQVLLNFSESFQGRYIRDSEFLGKMED
jgi:hypothetical protein